MSTVANSGSPLHVVPHVR